jgi:hypothetical protein
MRKMTLMKVEEHRKRYKTSTTVVFASDGYIPNEGIQKLEVDFDDQFLPELGERLMVVVEAVPDIGPRHVSDAEGDPYADYLQKRKDAFDGAKPAASRKFR